MKGGQFERASLCRFPSDEGRVNLSALSELCWESVLSFIQSIQVRYSISPSSFFAMLGSETNRRR